MTVRVGIDVGGTKILAVALDEHASVVAERRVPSPVGFEPLVEALAGVTADLRDDAAVRAPVSAVGVGIAGMVDLDGRVVYSPNLPGLHDAPVGDALATAVGLPVVVENDANVAALAEATLGAARTHRHVLVVTLGTGIGGGLVVDGRIVRGAHGFFGEIGHVVVDRDGPRCACGARGHWEALASGTALGRRARALVDDGRGAGIAAAAAARGDDTVTGEHVGLAAASGDGDAIELLDAYADDIAVGLAGFCNVLDPDAVVIGGGVAALGEVLMVPLREAFDAHLEGTEVRPAIALLVAALGERASAIGAARLEPAP